MDEKEKRKEQEGVMLKVKYETIWTVCLILVILVGLPVGFTGNYWFLLLAVYPLLVGSIAFAMDKQ